MNTIKSHHRLAPLLKKLPAPTEILQGSLIRYYHEGCRCHPNGRYGPYWYLSIQRQGKTKMVLVPKEKLSLVRQYLRNWKRYLRLIRTIMDKHLEIIKKED